MESALAFTPAAIIRLANQCPDGAYADANAYWKSYDLLDLIEEGSQDERARWREQVADLRSAYRVLSDHYQDSKQERVTFHSRDRGCLTGS